MMIIISPPTLRSKGREKQRETENIYIIDKTYLTDLLVFVHRRHPFVGHFVVLFCLCFSPTRERDRERERERDRERDVK